jgi:transposase-like protein
MAAPFTRVELARAVEESRSWTETVRRLGYAGNNTRTVRKYAASWEVSTDHFDPDAARKEAIGPRFTEEQLREAVAGSLSVAEALRRLGYCHTGGNPQTLKKYVGIWGISTDHFDPEAGRRRALEINGRSAIPLEQVLVEGSSYHRGHLKERLFEAGLKDRRCELCGQGDTWRGRPMSLVLDHINGVSTDNRLENLRLVCPNCAATLETHCGRKNTLRRVERKCARCGTPFSVKYPRQRYCSRRCGTRWDRTQTSRRGAMGVPRFRARKAERPPREQLLREINEIGYLAVGRKYGVSDTAIRKWVRQYERERAIAEGRDPGEVEIPRRTWPNRHRDQEAA